MRKMAVALKGEITLNNWNYYLHIVEIFIHDDEE